jgi:hypothetical protein
MAPQSKQVENGENKHQPVVSDEPGLLASKSKWISF